MEASREKFPTCADCAIVFPLLMAAFLCCSRPSSREAEPNDTAPAAMELRAGAPVEGFLDRAGDVDFYRIAVPDPSVLDVQLSAVRGINHSLKIWNGATGELLKLVDDARKSSPERMCNFHFGGGYVLVSVQHGEKDAPAGNRDNSYQLKIDLRGAVAGTETEPNDAPEKATPVAVNSEVTGYYSPAYNRLTANEKNPGREEDWFRLDIQLQEGRPLLLDLELSPVPEIDPAMFLYGPGMREILSAGGKGAGQGATLKGTGITEPGTYHIMVAAANGISGCDIPYVLSIKTRDYDFSLEMEPNNDMLQSNVIQSEEVTGKISHAGDRDFFTVKSSGGMRVHRVELIPPPDLDIAFNLYDGSKRRVFEVNTAGKGEREVLPNACSKDDIFIEVLSRGAPGEDAPYRLLVSSRDHVEGYEIEPNDDRKEATRVQGDTVTGHTTRKNDIDYYLLEYAARKKKRFTVNAATGSRLKVSVTDPLGYAVRSVTVTGGAETKFYEMIDRKGYLVVKSMGENYLEPYVITLKDE